MRRLTGESAAVVQKPRVEYQSVKLLLKQHMLREDLYLSLHQKIQSNNIRYSLKCITNFTMLHICSLPYVRMTTVGPYAVPIGRNKFTIEVPCQLKPFACIVGFMTNKRIDGDIGIT